MSECAEIYGAMKDARKHLRTVLGVNCPECVRLIPRACPSILIPGQRCRIHGYVDPRGQDLIEAEYKKLGWEKQE